MQQVQTHNQNQQNLSLEAKHLWDFRKYNPHTFNESLKDPAKAEFWLSSIETIFCYMKCLDDQQIQCVVFVLINDAKIGWQLAERSIDTSAIPATWEQFKERFYEQYFFTNMRYNKQTKFLNLKQEAMFVVEYEREFNKLSHFTPKLVATEKDKMKKFVQGLGDRVRGFIQALEPTSYALTLYVATQIDSRVVDE